MEKIGWAVLIGFMVGYVIGVIVGVGIGKDLYRTEDVFEIIDAPSTTTKVTTDTSAISIHTIEIETTLEETFNFLDKYDTSFKTYMNYSTITSPSSAQYALQQHSDTYTENNFRLHNGRYMVAIGTGFGFEVGDYIDVELDTRVVLDCVVGDIKDDKHTDYTNKGQVLGFTINGKEVVNVVEFIVANETVKMKLYGDVSHENDILKGNVIEIRSDDEK